MSTAWLGAAGAGVAMLIALGLALFTYLAAVLAWTEQSTVGSEYFERSGAERARFREALARHAIVLVPVLRLVSRLSTFDLERAGFRVDGLSFPRGSCSLESVNQAAEYRPEPSDLFVVTQMRSGTTWMIHLVIQVLERGEADLVGSDRSLHAISPWLESNKTLPAEQAPQVGTVAPARVIKTHLPVDRCPWSRDARYIYVSRDPVGCFASCADFLLANLGPFTPGTTEIADWFCSDQMWWGTWRDHVSGWLTRSREAENVMFVRFEEMKADLDRVIRDLADFLGLDPLTLAEVEAVADQCRFEYMRAHAHHFEMHPPHLLSVRGDFFVSGRQGRGSNLPEATRTRVRAWSLDGADPELRALYS